MTDKPHIYLRVPQFIPRPSFWICRGKSDWPGIGATPRKAWDDWVYINGYDKALQPPASAQSPN